MTLEEIKVALADKTAEILHNKNKPYSIFQAFREAVIACGIREDEADNVFSAVLKNLRERSATKRGNKKRKQIIQHA